MADISLSSPRRSSIAVVFAAAAAAPSGNDAALGTATGACVWKVVKLSKQSSHRFSFPCVDILLCLVDLLLLQLKDNLEEIPHGDDNLPRGLLRLDPKEAMAVLRTAVDVTEGAVVRHVLRDEADLVHRVMVEAILIWKNVKIHRLEDQYYKQFSPQSFHPWSWGRQRQFEYWPGQENRERFSFWNSTFCLCSPEALIAIFSSCSASYNICSCQYRIRRDQKNCSFQN